jgi:hypothetical protein
MLHNIASTGSPRLTKCCILGKALKRSALPTHRATPVALERYLLAALLQGIVEQKPTNQGLADP